MPKRLGKLISIYALCEPETETVRYVGASACPEIRLKEHFADKSNCAKVKWLDSLSGVMPNLIILESGLPEGLWQKREIFWISHFRELRCDLVNSASGGSGGILQQLEESHRKQAETLRRKYANGFVPPAKGKHPSEEVLRKRSETLRKKWANGWPAMKNKKPLSRDTILKQTESRRLKYASGYVSPLKGKRLSVKTRHKISEALLRKYASGWLARISPLKGRHLSEEACRKLSEVHRTEEVRRRKSESMLRSYAAGRSNSMKGKHLSAETLRKRSETLRWKKQARDNENQKFE